MLQGLQQCRVGIVHRVPQEKQFGGCSAHAAQMPIEASSSPSLGTAVQGPSTSRFTGGWVPGPGAQHGAGSAGGFWGCSVSKHRCCFSRYVSALTTPARLSPVDFHYSMTTQVPTFEITSPNSAHAVSLPPAAPISFRVEEQQPLLRRYQLPFQDTQRYDSYYQRKTYLNDSMGSLPSSPFRITEDDEYETTQEYVTALEQPKKTASSNRRWKKSKLNGHIPHRARAVRDSFSLSSASYSESDEELVAESTPFLSTQNNEAAHTESPPLHRPGDSRTHYSCRGHSAHGDGGRGSLKADPDPL